MLNADKLLELADCLKSLAKEQAALAKHSAASANFGNTAKRRDSAREIARECAIEVRRLKHEAHCLAVELGIADRRDDNHYTDSTAPAGFGRDFRFERRAPRLDANNGSAS